LENKLARQGELRNLTRKYAADIDGVSTGPAMRGPVGAARRLRGTLAALAQRVDELRTTLVAAAAELTKVRTKAAKALAKAVTAELAGLAMSGAGSASRWRLSSRGETTRRRWSCRPVRRCTPDTTA